MELYQFYHDTSHNEDVFRYIYKGVFVFILVNVVAYDFLLHSYKLLQSKNQAWGSRGQRAHRVILFFAIGLIIFFGSFVAQGGSFADVVAGFMFASCVEFGDATIEISI